MIASDTKKVVTKITVIAEQRPTGGAGAWRAASWQGSKMVPLLPPQSEQHAGKMTVLVGLNGTMVKSIPGEYAKRVPDGLRGYVTGQGDKLYPRGIFTVERPFLEQFLQRAHHTAEVVVHTELLPVHADPIIDKIEEGYGLKFAHRVYRDSITVRNGCYCIDMLRLDRDLAATVVVDDDPERFYLQPHNGIPVKPFEYDPDDHLLLEVIAPALELVALEPDVRRALRRRYNMPMWFKQRGIPLAQQGATLGTGTIAADIANAETQEQVKMEGTEPASSDSSDDDQGRDQLSRFTPIISVFPRWKPQAANNTAEGNAGDLTVNKKLKWSRWMGKIAHACAAMVACRG